MNFSNKQTLALANNNKQTLALANNNKQTLVLANNNKQTLALANNNNKQKSARKIIISSNFITLFKGNEHSP